MFFMILILIPKIIKLHLPTDSVEMMPSSVSTLVHDLKSVHLVAQGMIVVQILFLFLLMYTFARWYAVTVLRPRNLSLDLRQKSH